MIKMTLKGVEITPNARNVRAYQASRRTPGAAAELLIAEAAGESYVDTIPNRMALLVADHGSGHQALEESVGLHGQEIQGIEEETLAPVAGGKQTDGQGLEPIVEPIVWKKGDMAKWVSNGIVRFEAKKIRKIDIDKGQAFFPNSDVGVPFEELEKPSDQDVDTIK